MTKRYEAAVLGAGPGGYVAAIRLAQLGKKTVLIEKDLVGGTCLNRGCIPTKALLHSAEVYQTVLHAAACGVSAQNAAYDYAKIAANKDMVVKNLRSGVQYLLKNAGAEVVYGEGVLTDTNTIIVDGKDSITAENIIIATGSRPADIPIPGIDSKGVIDSDDVLAFTKAPESLVIIGGGVIGIEFATLFNALGKKVTVIEMLPQILTGVDRQISEEMRKVLTKKGIKIETSAKVIKIENNNGVVCYYEKDGKTLAAKGEVCVVAIGRKANIENIGLAVSGIKVSNNYIDVDERMRTSVTNVYAIGDITGKAQLAHVASAQGIVAAHNIAGCGKIMRYNIIPSCIYTSPEIACVGLDEQSAKDKGYDVKREDFLYRQTASQ